MPTNPEPIDNAQPPGPVSEHTATDIDAPPGAPAQTPPPSVVAALSVPQWMAAGLKAALGMRFDIGRASPSPLQLFGLLVVAAATQIGLARLEVPGDATFQLMGWVYPLCGTGFVLFWVWAALAGKHAPSAHPAPLPAWFALWTFAGLPVGALATLLAALGSRELLPAWWLDSSGWAWLAYSLIWVWLVVAAWRVTRCFTPSRLVRTRIVVGLVLMEVFTIWHIEGHPWQAEYATQDAGQDQEQGLVTDQDKHAPPTLSQEVFENQQALLGDTLAALSPRQAGRTNVFGVVYAPYAQDVFMRESAMVANVLQQRFGAAGHVVQLVNHPSVTDTIPWATNRNLRASLKAVADKMDRERDVLVVYLSSHGGSDFKLASAHGALQVDELTPLMLRTMLDETGVRNRVITVSACYSGGWIEPLSSDSALVMTAADATHTSYGCGSLSELTFFGRALFDEQLRKTHSFEEAFAAAVPIIQQREIEGLKDDGFSNPQIAVGKDIRVVLTNLERELAAQR